MAVPPLHERVLHAGVDRVALERGDRDREAVEDVQHRDDEEDGDAELGDVVVLAVWYGTNLELAKQLGTKLAGKVVVDIANPLNSTYDGLATAPDSSSAEDLAKAIASGAKVVKAFNTTYAGTLLTGEVAGQPLDVFIAGDDADAKPSQRSLQKLLPRLQFFQPLQD